MKRNKVILLSIIMVAIMTRFILLLAYMPISKDLDMKEIKYGIYYVEGVTSDYGSKVTSDKGLVYEIIDSPELMDGTEVVIIVDSNDTKRKEDDFIVYIKEIKTYNK